VPRIGGSIGPGDHGLVQEGIRMTTYTAPRRSPHGEWAYLTRDERDTAYNNSKAVANVAAIQAAREADSHAFRERHPAKLDLPYGPSDRTKWDLFPAPEPTSPCLVFIHGGYWQRGTREGVSVMAEGLRALGWSVAFPGYDLTPDVSLATIVAQIHAALDWLGESGPDHGIAGPIIVAGHSAGGHLTAMALAHPKVQAGLTISGVFELGPIRDIYLNEKLNLTDDEVRTLSPLRLPVVAKPMGIAYGTAELPALVDDSRALHARRSNAHAAGPLIPVPGADHFTILEELQKADGLLTRAIVDLLR
jgi:acetyl esterase/lipase